ncbi:MAG: fibrillarin-like rRNA/tRNA 2'-O-methyltransferase [Candidatus Diapherotrites archaeon]|nr:fibrillarin-like rRNA/tRNA 2'-O-methyltransferase [Candidatus Diapherotrites archaeon]
MEQLFEGIYFYKKSIYTQNRTPKKKVYGEELVKENGIEYREWDPYRSKYCAAIKKGLKENIFYKGANVLYLGSAEGTTVSHVSDIICDEGGVFCVDISEIAMNKLVKLAEERANILPILSDAQNTKEYEDTITEIAGQVDALFQDISQRNQAEIFIKNAKFLKKDGLGAISIKTKSISQSRNEKAVLEGELQILKKEFDILQILSLEPFEKSHYVALVKKK